MGPTGVPRQDQTRRGGLDLAPANPRPDVAPADPTGPRAW